MNALREVLGYPFVVNALVTGCAVAAAAAAAGYFMVCRRVTFAGHALPQIGFSGAAGALLLGVEPVLGLFALTLTAAAGMGTAGPSVRERDVAIGVVMTFAMGLGFLFLALHSGYAAGAYAILFGSILGISPAAARLSAWVSAASLVVLAAAYRPLLFSTFDPELARARGVPVTALHTGFLLLLALIVSTAVQLMGALLLFTLLVGPAGVATRLVKRPAASLALSVALGLAYVAAGILAAAVSGSLPVSFCIATLSFLVYLPVRLLAGPRTAPVREAAHSHGGAA